MPTYGPLGDGWFHILEPPTDLIVEGDAELAMDRLEVVDLDIRGLGDRCLELLEIVPVDHILLRRLLDTAAGLVRSVLEMFVFGDDLKGPRFGERRGAAWGLIDGCPEGLTSATLALIVLR
ncbi:hypothetical protein [Streptomyces sp. Ncost-T10-10d]|uniref:hypothetical protein n=1 Tax=Streptomyces sp. Ncost-T10-10d TaxID=1839774 RepID=UPI000B8130E2|nr:hypothetical protein [Streptomyces sp. Ncost-T10-10d]